MSGLRDELAALADEWDTSSTWDHETPCEDSEDCARCCARDLRALLDRFPPEAATVCACTPTTMHTIGCPVVSGPNDCPACGVELDPEGFCGWCDWGPDPTADAITAALAASPEEQDR